MLVGFLRSEISSLEIDPVVLDVEPQLVKNVTIKNILIIDINMFLIALRGK